MSWFERQDMLVTAFQREFDPGSERTLAAGPQHMQVERDLPDLASGQVVTRGNIALLYGIVGKLGF